jgi:hypothetical protein
VIKQLSPSLKIHHEHLVVHHSVYPGEPVISIELTGNAAKLLEWLGLDYQRWKQGFDSQDEYHQWLAGISAPGWEWEVTEGMKGSRIALGWARLVDQTMPVKDTAGHQKERIQKLEDFRTWLKGIGYSSYVKRPKSDIPPSPQVVTLPTATHKRIIVRTDVTFDVNILTGEMVQQGSSITTLDPAPPARDRPTQLDIEPRPLDVYAIETLRYFGKLEEYFQIVAERKVDMGIKVENKKRKEQNRNFALVNDSKAARDIKKAEGRWT